MAELSDEQAMAIADRQSARVGVVGFDAAQRSNDARVAVFEATGQPIADLYDAIAREPVPARLLDFVENYPLAAGSVAPQPRYLKDRESMAGLVRGFLASLLVRPAFAAALGIVVGAGAMWSVGVRTPLVEVAAASALLVPRSDGRIVAAGSLHSVLEHAVAANPLPGASGAGGAAGIASLSTRLTFDSDSGFCRQYDAALVTGGGFAGIGCRGGDGLWTIHMQLPLAAAPSRGARIEPAAVAAVAAVVEQMMVGEVLGSDEVTALVARGWRRTE